MILNATTLKLQAVLKAAVAATQPTATVTFYDVPQRVKTDNSEYQRGIQLTALNSTTEVDILAAPVLGTVRNIEYVNIYNGDSASVTVQVMIDDSGTNRIQTEVTLLTTESLTFTPDNGWSIQT